MLLSGKTGITVQDDRLSSKTMSSRRRSRRSSKIGIVFVSSTKTIVFYNRLVDDLPTLLRPHVSTVRNVCRRSFLLNLYHQVNKWNYKNRSCITTYPVFFRKKFANQNLNDFFFALTEFESVFCLVITCIYIFAFSSPIWIVYVDWSTIFSRKFRLIYCTVVIL